MRKFMAFALSAIIALTIFVPSIQAQELYTLEELNMDMNQRLHENVSFLDKNSSAIKPMWGGPSANEKYVTMAVSYEGDTKDYPKFMDYHMDGFSGTLSVIKTELVTINGRAYTQVLYGGTVVFHK